MLLVVDTGNTNTVVGLYEEAPVTEKRQADTGLLDHWRLSTNDERTADEHALLIQEFLGFHGFSFDKDVAGIAISSGVPRVTFALREMCQRYFGFRPVVIGPGISSGIEIKYENPHEVGADRVANAAGAYDLCGGPSIVVDFGTATTFDAISGAGEYIGGAILPGIEISLEALFARAALLRRVELVEPRNYIGRNTNESIQSGVVHGMSALVDGMVEKIETELGASTVIATGGLAGLIAPLAARVDRLEPHLTLHGLRLIYELNS